MLPLPELQSALEQCEVEVFWKPVHARAILAVPLWDEGMAGGVEVPSYKQRRKYQAIVVAVNETKTVEVGDLVCYDMGRGDEIVTYRGELFFHITERNVSAIDDEFGKPEATEKQLASGLWVSVSGG